MANRARKQRIFTDFTVSDHGTIFLVQPNTAAGRQWVEDHIPSDATFWGEAVVVEHRFIGDIISGFRLEGLGWN
jgi:hypothetical protein